MDTHCVNLRSDLGRSTPISPQPGCRMFSRVASRAPELGPQSTPTAHQQGRRPLPKDAAGAKRALPSGALWTGQRFAAMGIETLRARRKQCQETRSGCCRSKTVRAASQVVGKRGSLRTIAQPQQRRRSGGLKRNRNRRAEPPSSGDCGPSPGSTFRHKLESEGRFSGSSTC